uniref:Uncharacterized protein n=2 Tax=Aegilops tauschii subsp. strangulata TaxID=200361 RepID=A0A453FV52_AEGTS
MHKSSAHRVPHGRCSGPVPLYDARPVCICNNVLQVTCTSYAAPFWLLERLFVSLFLLTHIINS